MATTKNSKTMDGGGSDSPQRTDYKKVGGSEMPSTQNLLQMAKNGKGLNSKSLGIFDKGKK